MRLRNLKKTDALEGIPEENICTEGIRWLSTDSVDAGEDKDSAVDVD